MDFWEQWLPGVLNRRQIRQLIDLDIITSNSDNEIEVGHSSFDLRLSDECYIMKEGAIKPSDEKHYSLNLNKKFKLAERIKPNKDGIFILENTQTYIFKLQEELRFNDSKYNFIYGQATAKSTIGRMDVLARLIVDKVDRYDYFNLTNFSISGDLYVEITPITFKVKVKKDISIIQLRLFKGHPDESEIKGKYISNAVLLDSKRNDGTLSVDLSPIQIPKVSDKVSGICARRQRDDNDALQLWGKDQIDPTKYWKFTKAIEVNGTWRLKIMQDSFYILRSREKIALPASVAVYCRAMDETFGEMRIHYAGFVHPFFGMKREDGDSGTPLIFEVRGHDINVNLGDGEPLAKLIFYRMSENAEQTDSDREKDKDYNNQKLKLSKFFISWDKL